MKKILVIDDEGAIGQLLFNFLSRNGFEVETATSGLGAFEKLSNKAYDLVLCDFRLKDTDGREILKEIKANYPGTGVIIITAYSDIRLAVELIKLGAYDYISKPLYPNEILNTINKALETREAIQIPVSTLPPVEKVTPKKSIKTSTDLGYVVGESDVSLELMRQINLVAPTNFSVLIYGESGTGKEAVAKSIHVKSSRKDNPFIALDCGSLTKELAGSEFFGHEKGAPTCSPGPLFVIAERYIVTFTVNVTVSPVMESVRVTSVVPSATGVRPGTKVAPPSVPPAVNSTMPDFENSAVQSPSVPSATLRYPMEFIGIS
jgi:two-component system response regulator HydG